MALTTDTSILTAVGNDFGFDQVFARQIEALGRKGDVAIGITTSGDSPNVVRALEDGERSRAGDDRADRTWRRCGRRAADVHLNVPETSTARVQEVHTRCCTACVS